MVAAGAGSRTRRCWGMGACNSLCSDSSSDVPVSAAARGPPTVPRNADKIVLAVPSIPAPRAVATPLISHAQPIMSHGYDMDAVAETCKAEAEA